MIPTLAGEHQFQRCGANFIQREAVSERGAQRQRSPSRFAKSTILPPAVAQGQTISRSLSHPPRPMRSVPAQQRRWEVVRAFTLGVEDHGHERVDSFDEEEPSGHHCGPTDSGGRCQGPEKQGTCGAAGDLRPTKRRPQWGYLSTR